MDLISCVREFGAALWRHPFGSLSLLLLAIIFGALLYQAIWLAVDTFRWLMGR